MARKKVSPEELRRIERAREIKQKSKKSKPGPDDEKGDAACAICDDGGYVTCCDGGCQRSFHLGDEHDDDAECRFKLGITEEKAKMINEKKEKFICMNCKYKQHQCFACGLLGSSDLTSQAEVFQCEHEDCARFYHPKCVAKLLYPNCKLEATLFEDQVVAGEKFTCPMHECFKCRGVENKNDYKMQFAVCRRCPTVYHRDCLPSDILFKPRKGPNGSLQRVWDDILPNRILFYCKKHEIIRELGTPKRNHIVFPDAKKILVPKVLEGPSMEQDKTEKEDLLKGPPMEQDKPEEEEFLEVPHKEQEKTEVDELLDQQTMPEPSQLPPAAAKKQCLCSGPFDSFAPKALFMHPQPGSCGWLDD